MNIEKIKYFIDLVECRNFTDTAKKNHISQTTVSQQIASLEKEFDVRLINRKQIPIQPTSAGQIFYREALVMYKQYIHMKEKMNNHVKEQNHILNVEYAAATDLQSLMKFMPNFMDNNQNVKVQLNKVPLREISAYLKKGAYDLAIAFDSEFVNQKEIATKTLYEGNYCAVVGEKHPLYHHKVISNEELYQYPLVMLTPEVIGNSYDLMVQHAYEDGYQPKIIRTVDDVESELFYIVAENLIGFFPENYQLPDITKRVKMIPLIDSHHTFKVEIGYLIDNGNPALQLFLEQFNDLISQ